MRKCESLKSSGGILMLVKNSLQKFTKQILNDGTYEEMVWLHINTTTFGLKKDIVVGCIYTPPKDSIFYQNKDFVCNLSAVESALISIQLLYENVDIVLMGDMNARTRLDLDYVKFDKPDHIPGLESFYEIFAEQYVEIDVPRKNSDRIINPFGKHLLEMCWENNLVILNGRKPSDSRGNFTYVTSSGASTIDYILVSNSLFKSITDFCVLTPDISKHFPISCTLQICLETYTDKVHNATTRYKWKGDFADKFDAFINTDDFIDKLEYISDNLDLTTIDNTVLDLNKLLQSIGDKSNMKTVSTSSIVSRPQPPWFDSNLRSLKHERCNFLNTFRITNSQRDLERYVDAKHSFKDEYKLKEELFKKSLIEKLCDERDSSVFWSNIKTHFNTNKAPAVNISIDDWYDHFKTLLNPTVDTSDVNFDNFVQQYVTEHESNHEQIVGDPGYAELNREISEAEIIHAIGNLKAGKAPGEDLIPPEFYKRAVSQLLPLLHKLYNCGTIPKNWSKSIIQPLHKKGDTDILNNYRGI
ncbi:hypothetical protein SNE40_019413 [Patella caerulea]|uniref:Endonuclease/exonuclease/phosphatase domain-containing protein n=1 Tax=Patella caerulea TaxID=87958 RepID=A0AAN8PIK5_PATCE